MNHRHIIGIYTNKNIAKENLGGWTLQCCIHAYSHIMLSCMCLFASHPTEAHIKYAWGAVVMLVRKLCSLFIYTHSFLTPKGILNSAYWCMADGRTLFKKMLLEPPLFLKHYNFDFETEKITLFSLYCTERKAFEWVACTLFLVVTKKC